MSTDPDHPVGRLSEGEILRRILDRTGVSADALVGPGDDAAVLTTNGAIVASTDTLVHGPDFRLAWSSPFDLGWKAAAVNLADIAAMGARPTALLVALALPDETSIGFVEQMSEGLRAACDALAPGCAVVGGDLTVSPTLVIAVTALGALDGRPPVVRGGARDGDVLAVRGALGRAAGGLALLFDRFRDASGLPVPVDAATLTADEAALLRAQLCPAPPVADGVAAARAGARALIDVSDGLVLDASRLAEASGITVDLDAARVAQAAGSVDATALDRALAGGEDHALLGAFAGGAAPEGWHVIGVCRERGEHAVLVDGAPYTRAGGWDPYRDWDAATG